MDNFSVPGLTRQIYSGRRIDKPYDAELGYSVLQLASDFGDSELFNESCHVFSHLDAATWGCSRGFTVAPGHKPAEYSSYEISRLTRDIDEKFTQRKALAESVSGQAATFEAQVARNPGKVFAFYAPVRVLEAHIQHHLMLTVSILDLYAKLAHVFNKSAREKFGQQIADTRANRIWDQRWQDHLLNCRALGELRDVRNEVSHNSSFKLRPYLDGRQFSVAIVHDFSDDHGLRLVPFLEGVNRELIGFVKFADAHFASKAPGLQDLLVDNAL
jgi:hypothetical protein